MRLSFSTKGWKKLSFDKVAAIAADMHFGGIELYNLHKREDMTGKGRPLHIYSVAACGNWAALPGYLLRFE